MSPQSIDACTNTQVTVRVGKNGTSHMEVFMRNEASLGISTHQHANGRIEFKAVLYHAGRRWVVGGFSTNQDALAAGRQLRRSHLSHRSRLYHDPS